MPQTTILMVIGAPNRLTLMVTLANRGYHERVEVVSSKKGAIQCRGVRILGSQTWKLPSTNEKFDMI